MIKSLRITNPNPTTTTVESNFDDFYTTGLMILEIAVNLCQNQLKKSSSDGNASATKTTINIFESQNCKSLKCTIKDPPKNRTHLKHSKPLTFKNSKLKIQTLWILHQVSKLESPREKPRKPKLSKSTQMKIQQNYTKNKDFFPL